MSASSEEQIRPLKAFIDNPTFESFCNLKPAKEESVLCLYGSRYGHRWCYFAFCEKCPKINSRTLTGDNQLCDILRSDALEREYF